MNLKNIIKRPVITEKVINQTAFGEYTFMVDRSATKDQIKEAVEKFFEVNVIRVRTLRLKGKAKKVGKLRKTINLPDRKKAVVKLKEGQKIEYFEVGGGEK